MEYMIITFDITENFSDIACKRHQYDKTICLQFFRSNTNSDYYKNIEEFRKESGIRRILNERIKLNRFPKVATYEDAFFVFENSGHNYLQPGDNFISKRKI